MNKSDLTKEFAKQTNLTIKEAELAVENIFKIMAETLSKKENIKIRNFGSFSLKETKERRGFNPATKQEITIKSKKKVKFTPYRAINIEQND